MVQWLPGLLLVSILLCGCREEERPVPAEDRMQRVVLGEDDRKAIQAPEYALFRQAVLRVRTLESERPQLDEADPASVEAYAAFLDQLSLANQDASAIIVADGWTSNQRRLMQRVLQRATSDEVSGEGR